MTESKPAARSVRPPVRRHRVLFALGLFTWTAFVVWIACYAWSWRTMRWPPDFRWVLGTGGTFFVFSCLTFVIGTVQFLLGPRRVAALAGTLLGTMPLIVFLGYFAELYWRADTRQNIHRHPLVDCIGMFASDVADAEVELRKLERTEHERFFLIYDSAKEAAEPPAQLIQAMNQHIESMCQILESNLEEKPFWVRHPLLGQSGRSLWGWALTDQTPISSTELSYLDRHEIAHAVISLMCKPVSNPPAVLLEGWAEFQSKNLESMCLDFLNQRAQDLDFPTANELVQDRWYSRSYGPVYSWGGPLVGYLIETSGGPTFFQLYRDSTQASFLQDVQRIYNRSWSELCDGFEDWLRNKYPQQYEGQRSSTETVTAWHERIELSDRVNRRDWDDIVASIQSQEYPKYPPRFDAKLVTQIRRYSGDTSSTTSTISRVAFSNREAFLTRDSNGSSRAWASTPENSLTAFKAPGEKLRTGCSSARERSRQEIFNLVQAWVEDRLAIASPTILLQRVVASASQVMVEELEEDFSNRRWIVKLRSREEDKATSHTLIIDPQFDWRCVQYHKMLDDDPEQRLDWSAEYSKFHGAWLPTEASWEQQELDGRSSYSERIVPMNDREVLSLRDEVLSIPVQPCEEGVPVPLWILATRSIATLWSGLGCLLGLLVRLFRI